MKNKILSAILVIATLFVLAASAGTVSAAGKSDYTYEAKGSGVVITSYTGSDTALTIPEYIDGKPVVGIATHAFYGKNLKTVSIPGTCKSIGNSAFEMNSNLKTVYLNYGVETIGDSAFSNCGNLESINLPKSVSSIGFNAFAFDPKLKIECYDGTYGATYAKSNGISYQSSPVYGVAATITRKPSKLVFYEGEELVTDGLVIEVQYNDGTTSSYTRGYTVSGYNTEKVGTQLITVRFEDVSATYTVTVIPNGAVELELIRMPDKKIYMQGETLDLLGIEVKAYLESGDVFIASDGFEAEYDFSEVGTTPVTITYKGKSLTFNVTVIHNAKEISIANAPKKTIYTVGDEFEPDGLKLTAVLKDGSVITVDGDGLEYVYDFSEPGVKTVTVLFGGQAATFNVTVKGPTTIRYIGLDEEFMPKTVYKVGEKFNPVGMYIYVKYSDGSATLVSWKHVEYYLNGRYATNVVLDKVGTYRIAYGYAGQGDNDLIIYVSEDGTMPVSSISIHTLPTKTTYAPGESLSTEGMQIFVNYADGTTAIIDSGFSATANLTAAGTQVVTVGYKGATATFEVTVSPVTVSSIAVTKNPTKTTYKTGETFSSAGLEVTATYSDGTKKAVTGYTLSVVDTASAGTKTVTVTYEGKTATFTVTVEKSTESTSQTETQTETQTTPTESQTTPTESQTTPTESQTTPTESQSESQTQPQSESQTSGSGEASATESSSDSSGTTKKASLWWIFLIIALILVIVLIVLYFIVFKKNNDGDEKTEETEETETEEETAEETTEETAATETEEAPAEETPAEETSEEAPADEAAETEEAPAEETPTEETPTEETTEETTEEKTEEAPADEATEETSEETPAEETTEETTEEKTEETSEEGSDEEKKTE